MKVFFALLLLLNVAFAAFQWLVPYDQLFAETPRIAAAEQLQLLAEAGTQTTEPEPEPEPEPEIIAEVEAETDAIAEAVARIEQEIESQRQPLVTEDTSDRRMCYTIGPFKDKARAIELSGRYSSRDVGTDLKSSLDKQYLGMMVYIDEHDSRAQAVKTANDLSAKGIRDHIIVKEDERPYLLSLGVFGLKRNADRLKSRVENLGFPVKTEARYRERTIYWLYGEQSSEVEMHELLGDEDLADGISQIPTQCLPT